MKRTAIIVGSITVIALAATGAMAKGWGRGAGRGSGQGPAVQQLSQEQLGKLQEARAAFLQETLQLRQTMANKGQELRTLMAQKDYDQAKAKALAYELVDLRAQMSKMRIDHRIKIKNDLGIDLPMGKFGRMNGRRGPGSGMGANGPGMMGNGPGMGGYGPRMMGNGPCGQGYGPQAAGFGPGMGGRGQRRGGNMVRYW